MPTVAYKVNIRKKGRKFAGSTSGDLVTMRKDRVIKFFLDGNAVQPERFGRTRQFPPKNHAVVTHYAEMLNAKPSKTRDERIYGAPPPATYHVRSIALKREGRNYHVVERIKGPNLLDFLHFVESGKGPKFRGGGYEPERQKADIEMRRQGLADLVRANKKLMKEWAPKKREFMNELYRQMEYIRNEHGGMLDIYAHQMKETDFMVEGLEKGKDGRVRLKLVLVDFK